MCKSVIKKTFPYILPFIRLALSIVLVKVVASSGGYGYLDALAIAIVHSSFAVLFTLPWLARLRVFLRRGKAFRRFPLISGILIYSAAASFLIFSLVFSFFYILFQGFIPVGSDEFLVYIFVFIAASGSICFLPVEYVCGRFGCQSQIRFLELILFCCFAIISIVESSGFIAACSIYFSTLISRIIFSVYFHKKRNPLSDVVSSLFPILSIRRFLSDRKGWMLIFGNFSQCLSSAIVYSYSFSLLPSGVVAQVSLAYRFAGPMQLLSGQFAYATWQKEDVKKGAFLASFMFICAIVLTLLFPVFMEKFLGLNTHASAPALGLVACVHIAVQGFCQVKSSYLYSIKNYELIAASAVPHAFLAFLSPWFIFLGIIDDPFKIMLLLTSASLLEFFIISEKFRLFGFGFLYQR